MLAEAANPEWVSVPLVGWSLARALSKSIPTHIVTQVRNRESFLRAGLVEGKDFTAIDNESTMAPMWRLGDRLRGGSGKGWTTSTAFSSLGYYSFEQLVWSIFENRLRSKEFCLVHRITPLSPTSQSPIASRLAQIGVPFVVGPLNGGIPWPINFRHRQSAEHDWLSSLRSAYKLLPHYGSMRKAAAAILCGSIHTMKEMPSGVRSKCIYLPENGVDLTKFPLADRRRRDVVHAAFVGRLVPYKGVDILLQAATESLLAKKLHLHIVGEGPQGPALRDLAGRLAIQDSVTFHGWVEHGDIKNVLAHCDFTVLPSIREFGGGAVLESLAMGLPVIVADYGGPAELIAPSRGARISFTDESTLLAGLKSQLREWVENPRQLSVLGASGRSYVEQHLTWDAKAKQVSKVYDQVLSGHSDFTSLDVFPKPFGA